MNKIIRSLSLCSLVAAAVTVTACGGGHNEAARPAPAPRPPQQGYAPQGYPQQAYPQQAPPPAAHPGFVYYQSPQQQPPAPTWVPPPAVSRVETLNLAHLQQVSSQPHKCSVPREVAPGVFAHVDCYPYRRVPVAVKHATPAKLAMMARGHVKWNALAPLVSPARTGVRGAAPAAAIRSATPGGGANVVGDAPQAYPDAVDHRLNNLEGPIKDQGDVGDCTAFALSAVMDNAFRRSGVNITSSPEHLWAHYGVPTMEDAATANLNKGITTFDAWPYSGREACELTRDGTDDCGSAYNVAPNTASRDSNLQATYRNAEAANGHKVVAFEELSVGPVNLDEITATLASGADLWVAFMIDSSVWVNRSMQNFVIPDWSSPDGGHAVAIAGYRNTPQGKQFLIHNSWGPKWGDNGYAWVSQKMIQQWLHLAYKIRTDVDGGTAPPAPPPVAPTPTPTPVAPPPAPPPSPQKPKTDEDCPGDQVVDSVTAMCAPICVDQSRPANGQCANGQLAQLIPGALQLPGFTNGFPQIPGLPGWPPSMPQQPASNGAQPTQPTQPTQAGQPQTPQIPFALPSAWPAPWPVPSGLPNFFPQAPPPPKQ